MDNSVECKTPVSFEDWFVEFNVPSLVKTFVEFNAPPLVLARSRGTVVLCCGAGSVAVVLVPHTGLGNSKGGMGMNDGVGGDSSENGGMGIK